MSIALPFPDDVCLIKFLPDCQISSALCVMEPFAKIMIEHQKLFDKNINLHIFNIQRLEQHLTEHNFDVISWRSSEEAIIGGRGGEIRVILSEIPHIKVSFNPPLKERNRSFAMTKSVLEKGLVDVIESHEPEIETNERKEIILLGQAHWIYLYKKMERTYTLVSNFTQNTSQGGLSPLNKFTEQLEKVSLLFDSHIQLSMPYTRRRISNHEIINNFLKDYDQQLLTSWGSKQFRANLAPLGVSLEDWLKANGGWVQNHRKISIKS